MTPDQIQNLIDYLRKIGEAAVEKGFELAMLEVQVKIIQHSIFFALSIISLGVAVVATRAALQYESKNTYDEGSFHWGMLALVLYMLGGIGFIVTVLELVGYLINPEWRAIEIVLGVLR